MLKHIFLIFIHILPHSIVAGSPVPDEALDGSITQASLPRSAQATLECKILQSQQHT
jgi:hypothetical protein